ncbi:alpha/beta hydrolase [Sporichthya brevicatena]|uniref:Alpha/beta hydrolase n=1 Tax=Sporichthya brevicatena TaxID=171442 RepID=A0ABN1GAQ1_9ACTN
MLPILSFFRKATVSTAEVPISVRVAGSGPGLLLLHGFPQTGAMWHRIAPALSTDYTVVVADLRGYGGSGKPDGKPGGELYSKRAMAQDMVEVMEALGFGTFTVVGHDRGGRVAHRMALDHAERIEQIAVLDILPTHTVFRNTNEDLARSYYHWFFLSQPYDLPERMIGADPEFYLRWCLRSWSTDMQAFSQPALDEYVAAFSDPATIHAACEDYRAGAGIDLEHDEADLDTKITAPLLALWGEHGYVGRKHDVVAEWQKKAVDVRGEALPSAHFLPEEAPVETYAALRRFLTLKGAEMPGRHDKEPPITL